ncbi:c-type cytochrome [Tropicimonas sp. S265A]|uniref:c-type cytochrome n=1 Tax=Tropicimonas sp. S265A TaxID=3415134 RepID=UPI003C7BD573
MRSACLLLMVLASPGLAADPAPSDRGMEGFVTVDRLPVPSDPVLARGREIWGGTCQNCHGGDSLTGAPKVTSTRAWAPRIDQGMEVLIEHAINGFIGPRYTEMPARGGKEDLSDTAVSSAVAFMVWASGGAEIATAFAQSLTEKD